MRRTLLDQGDYTKPQTSPWRESPNPIPTTYGGFTLSEHIRITVPRPIHHR